MANEIPEVPAVVANEIAEVPLVMAHKILTLPLVDEGSCLLYPSGLPTVENDTEDSLFFHYKFNNTNTEQEPTGTVKFETGTGKTQHDDNPAGLYQAGGFPVLGPHVPKPDIQIIQYIGCDETTAEGIINKQSKSNSPSTSVFKSPNLDRHEGFITGISLRESGRTNLDQKKILEQKKIFTLFVAIPHLGLVVKPVGDLVTVGSKTLQEYRLTRTAVAAVAALTAAPAAPAATTGQDIIVVVHQTWFVLFDDGIIGIFRSRADELATRAPLFPFQTRQGAVQVLVHLLSNSITAREKAALRVLEAKVSEGESDLWQMIQAERKAADEAEVAIATATAEAEAEEAKPKVKGATTAVTTTPTAAELAAAEAEAAKKVEAAKKKKAEVESLTHSLEGSLTDFFTILRLVRCQIQKLEELLRIIQNGSTPKSWNKHPQNWNPFEIGIFARSTEEMMDVQLALEEMIMDRERVLVRTNSLIQDLQGTISRFSQQGQARSTENALKQQAAAEKKMFQQLTSTMEKHGTSANLNAELAQEALDKQGQTISVFTFIVTIFLPLGFLCAYYSINIPDFQGFIHTEAQFWMLSAPVTFAILIIMSLFMFGKDDAIKEWMGGRLKAFRPAPDTLPR